ncbi:phosphoribosyltransferase-like protein [Serratia ureilytica]|uniref:phosphoribosyltransferase-like protein n=1 Tax=Serratia ureilytica TaxID=300181 RepID=UPI003F6CFD6E
MKYPISLSKRIDEVKSIVESWPVEKDIKHVLNWLMQFDNDDIDLAIRVIKNLNVIGFEDLNTALIIAYSKLERMSIDKGTRITNKNTLFAGIGDGAKSGAMIGYNFRIINELPEGNFMGEDSLDYLEKGLIDNIVLIDDIVGTGRQATEEIRELTQKVTPLGVKNIFLLTAIGMRDGINEISMNTKAHVFSAYEYTELDTVTCLDSPFYDGIPHEERADARSRLEYYGGITNRSPLGYGGIGALISFYYNTPNISLPMIWGSKNSWLPLFKRAVKINGINSYYKQIESSINKKKKDGTVLTSKENQLTILVEGSFDEMFFDYIISLIKDQLPFEKISVIALGGFSSKKLIDNIVKLNSHCLFIVEDDDQSPRGFMERFLSNIGDNPYVLVKPFTYYLDLDSMIQSDKWSRVFPKSENVDEQNNVNKIKAIELRIKMRIHRNEARFKELLENHLDESKFKLLSHDLLSKIVNNAGQ